MGKLPRIGLRGKLSILIIIIVAALSLALNYFTAHNLADAINQEYISRATQLAAFYGADFNNHNENGKVAAEELQQEIDSLIANDSEIKKISVYAPTANGVQVIASSSHQLVGSLADNEDAAPIYTNETAVADRGEEDGEEESTAEKTEPSSDANLIEMLAPLDNQDGNPVASLGLYLDTSARDSLIFSQQVRFFIISNGGLLLLLLVLYFFLHRLFVGPVRELTYSTSHVLDKQWTPAKKTAQRNDEMGDLARAFDEMTFSLGSREEEVKLLLSASVAVSSELHVDKILQILCDKIACSQKVTYCRIALIDDIPGDTLVVRAETTTREVTGWQKKVDRKIPLADVPCHREVIVSMKPVVLHHNGSLDESITAEEREWALTADTKSALLLPLISKGEILGVVTLGESRRWERSRFSARKIEFYQILLSQASVAIENAQLYEKTEWQVRELSIMHKISQAFTSTLDYQEVVSIVAHRVGSFVGAQYVSVLLPDEKNQYLNIVASYNLCAEYIWTINKKNRISMGEGPIGKAFSDQEPVQVTDVDTDGSYRTWRHVANVQGYSSFIAIPLTAKNEAIGVICIYFAEPKRLRKNEVDLLVTAANEAAIAIENSKIYENLQDAFVGTIKSLAETIDAKDAYTRGHSEKVSLYAVATARSMGLDSDELQTIRYAGYLHDVGKIGIPDAILTKPGKLTVEEFSIIKKHPVVSDRILKPVDFPYPVQPLVRHHHERFDGKGYPDGLSGEEIPLGARILAVADSYEAMTEDRPYRKALSVEKALDELVRNRSTQFDPTVVTEFVKIVSSEKTESPRIRIGA